MLVTFTCKSRNDYIGVMMTDDQFKMLNWLVNAEIIDNTEIEINKVADDLELLIDLR